MMIFGVCFVLYLIKLSAGKGLWIRMIILKLLRFLVKFMPR